MRYIGTVVVLALFVAPAASNRNLDAIKKYCAMDGELSGQNVSKALMEKFQEGVKELYAPKIDCTQVPASEAFGFNLKGVPVEACNNMIGAKYAGIQVLDMHCGDIAIDEHSNNVLIREATTLKLSTGATVSTDTYTKYDFDAAGKIVAYSSQFDTAAIAKDSPAAKNSAAAWRDCENAKTMIGQAVSAASLEKYRAVSDELFAPIIDCDMGATSKEFGVSLKGVSTEACMAAYAVKYSGLQVISLECLDAAATEDGRHVLLWKSSKVKSAAGALFEMLMASKYTFNGAGKIVATSAVFDTSILTPASVALVTPAQSWNPSPVLAFAVGAFAAASVMYAAMKRLQPSFVQDGYTQCA